MEHWRLPPRILILCTGQVSAPAVTHGISTLEVYSHDVRFQTCDASYFGPSLYWGFARVRLVVGYRSFRTAHHSRNLGKQLPIYAAQHPSIVKDTLFSVKRQHD
jgi:hypothetical protein